MAMSTISTVGVTKTYGHGETAVQALRGVDIEVHDGELIILAGPSGSGKSTLLSIMAGILNADSGQATLLGVDWFTLSADAKAQRRAQFVDLVFQQFNLVPTLQIVENVAVPLLIRGVARREAFRIARVHLDAVGLMKRSSSMPHQLSGGMQQRAGIARALTTNPRVLICDEPTANLDSESGRGVMDLLRAATTSGAPQPHGNTGSNRRCVMVVTHDERLFGYADRVIRMADGRITNPAVASGRKVSAAEGVFS